MLIPFLLLIMFAILLGFNVADEATTVAKVTSSKDNLNVDGRNIYYEYEFNFKDLKYVGADYETFSKNRLGDALKFVNQTNLNINFCKSNPSNNGFENGLCIIIFWPIGVAMSTFLSLIILSFWVQECINGGLKKDVQTDAMPL